MGFIGPNGAGKTINYEFVKKIVGDCFLLDNVKNEMKSSKGLVCL